MLETVTTRLTIIGGGPAGYTAAIYAARGGLSPVCIEGYSSGGQVTRSAEIHNFPGFPTGVSGSELADLIRAQATGFGARIVTEDALSVDLSGHPFVVTTSQRRFESEALIVATGSRPRQLGLPAEEELVGRGVCFCAICDGPFFAGQRVAVIGGGDAAVEEALALKEIAASVTLIHRRREFRANATIQAVLADTPEITVRTPYVVTDLLANEAGLTGLSIRDTETGQLDEVGVDGLFITIGHEPASEMFTPWLATDPSGFLLTEPHSTATTVPGVFAAGDVADPRYRQAVTAAASGCEAAIDAERWLNHHRSRPVRTTAVIGSQRTSSPDDQPRSPVT
jgi:thioredoxin reductase (NADPH)